MVSLLYLLYRTIVDCVSTEILNLKKHVEQSDEKLLKTICTENLLQEGKKKAEIKQLGE